MVGSGTDLRVFDLFIYLFLDCGFEIFFLLG
jgi:hypothetical protein